MKISTESKMDFDYSVTTEDRFALRNYVDQLVEAVNHGDRGAYEGMLDGRLSVEGFSEQPLDKTGYQELLEQHRNQKIIRVIRFPELRIKFRHYLYHLTGTYEEFVDGILSYEGTMDMVIAKEEEKFKLVVMKFFPRLRMEPNEAA